MKIYWFCFLPVIKATHVSHLKGPNEINVSKELSQSLKQEYQKPII